MTYQAVKDFRKKYRKQISQYYSPYLHVSSVFGTGLLAILYCSYQLEHLQWWELVSVPLTLLAVNFAEYSSHRWAGHKKTPGAKLFYKRHTGDHHSFFIDSMMPYESRRDWRVILFPLWLIFVFVLFIVIPGIYLLRELSTDNIGYLFGASAIFAYLFYELMHFSYHLPRGSFIERSPMWRELRQLHLLHHRRDLMKKNNFNITIPIFDLLLGTLHWQTIKADQRK